MAARRPSSGTFARYVGRLVTEFRGTLGLLGALVALGALANRLARHPAYGGARPPWDEAAYSAWMALFAQPAIAPCTWYQEVMCAVAPLLGLVLLGEGVVRLGLLIVSRQQGEKAWMLVMASTLRDHMILCGLGHLGFRVFGRLVDQGVPVVAIEKDAAGRFVREAKGLGAPVLVRDMREDDALLEAGVRHARAIIIATSDDMANLEVALDARRMNPNVRILMRLFDQRLADKLKEAGLIDEAFSSAALAAPAVVDLARRAP